MEKKENSQETNEDMEGREKKKITNFIPLERRMQLMKGRCGEHVQNPEEEEEEEAVTGK